ncbi:hypothetical protein HS088_TW16G00563 [Tripterygium wilfordii]|uniref:Uncharacterized protein n=1 Tax=Tripterygium wilfordii TaxID=458696 RepID=A0A7J7CJE2_TRIWF|nr:uncharacterized protein LOC119980799 [Tripterygium wilfordii]KAF5734121.1 hypothetical protein HS088_TW16G00563 [Tripterygium wilfordii]
MDTRSDLIALPSTTLGEGGDHTAPGKRLSSSSSASCSSSGDPFELDANKADKSAPRTAERSNHGKHSQLASDFSEDDIPISSMPPSDHPDPMNPNNGSSTQSLPTQMLQQVSDDVANATPSAYRIPPSVFARTNTNAPMEWSVTSNESLFSLHMGNMSFTRDQLLWMGKSGELGLAGDPTIMYGQMMDFSSNQPPTPVTGKSTELIDLSSNQPPSTSKSTELIDCSSDQPPIRKSTEVERRNADLEARFGVTETTAAATMMEVIRENDANAPSKEKPSQAKEPTTRSSSISRNSDCSGGASVRSFAFPIVTGDANKSGSLKVRSEKRKQQSQSPKVSSEPNQELQPQTPKPEDANKSPKPKPSGNASQRKWLSCFSCCQFCS